MRGRRDMPSATIHWPARSSCAAAAGGYGHVAYVESVDGTSFTVSEMNVSGLGVLTTRTYDMVSNPPPSFIGFVYWRFGDEPANAPTDMIAEGLPLTGPSEVP